MDDKGLYAGLMRLHILHHAADQVVCGVWVMEELPGHGYVISPGTLYPMLLGLERKGYLLSIKERVGKTMRRLYSITSEGKSALSEAKEKVRELNGELIVAPK